jgi:acetolactate synthase-1/2/3 large subunit
MRVSDKKLVVSSIEKAMDHNGPFLLDFVVEPEENVFPIVPPGAALVEAMEMPIPEKVTRSSK